MRDARILGDALGGYFMESGQEHHDDRLDLAAILEQPDEDEVFPPRAPAGRQSSCRASEFVDGAQRGDREALRVLLVEVVPYVARAVRSIVGIQSANSDDLIQEALLAFVRSLPAYRGEAPVERYASRIAVRIALPECRKNRNRSSLFSDFALREKVSKEREPTDGFVRVHRRDLVRALIEELPEPQAYAFAHHIIWGASLEEIASDQGVSTNTVRTRLRLAKEAIRKRLEGEPDLAQLLGRVR